MSTADIVNCQAILTAIQPGITISVDRGRAYLSWDYGTPRRFRWDAPEGSDFPTWSREAPWGGTRSACTNMLIRRLFGKPVWPLGTWLYLIDGPAGLARHNRDEVLAAIKAWNWPEEVPCILCGKAITQCGDWWTIPKVGKLHIPRSGKRISGPSCSMRDYREVQTNGATP